MIAVARRVGLLGGSFDPVHRAHVELAHCARRHLSLDSVKLMPAAQPWQRGSLGADAQHRVEMLKLAIADEPGLEVSTIEIDRGGPTYTIDTVRLLPSENSYFWILGADQLENFCSWKDWKEIIARVHLAVAARPGSSLQPPPQLEAELQALNRTLHVIPMTPDALSATAIRHRLNTQQNVEGMLNPGVAQYIHQHGLYRDSAV